MLLTGGPFSYGVDVESVLEGRLRELAEQLKGPDARRLRKQVGAEDVAAVALLVVRVVTTQLRVVRVLALDRHRPARTELLFKEEIRGPRRLVAALDLPGEAYGEQILVAVIGAIQVVA